MLSSRAMRLRWLGCLGVALAAARFGFAERSWSSMPAIVLAVVVDQAPCISRF
jgi:hypothetical protein